MSTEAAIKRLERTTLRHGSKIQEIQDRLEAIESLSGLSVPQIGNEELNDDKAAKSSD